MIMFPIEWIGIELGQYVQSFCSIPRYNSTRYSWIYVNLFLTCQLAKFKSDLDLSPWCHSNAIKSWLCNKLSGWSPRMLKVSCRYFNTQVHQDVNCLGPDVTCIMMVSASIVCSCWTLYSWQWPSPCPCTQIALAPKLVKPLQNCFC